MRGAAHRMPPIFLNNCNPVRTAAARCRAVRHHLPDSCRVGGHTCDTSQVHLPNFDFTQLTLAPFRCRHNLYDVLLS